MMYFSIFYGYFVANIYKDFGSKYIDDDRFLTIVGAVSAACAGFRFVWSFLMQKLSFKLVYSIMLVSQIIVSTVLYWSARNRIAYLICVSLTIWIEGGHFTTLPTVCGFLYDAKGSQVFTIVFLAFGVSSMTGVFFAKVLLEKVFSYLTIFLICAAMSAVSLILLHTMFKEESYKPHDRHKSLDAIDLLGKGGAGSPDSSH